MKTESENMWRGVLIEESLTNQDLISHVIIRETVESTLEGEEHRGKFHFHKIEVDESQLAIVLDLAMRCLKRKGWYFHLVKGNLMKIAFPGKVFDVYKDDNEQFQKIREYGISLGIHKDQLSLEPLIENPFGE